MRKLIGTKAFKEFFFAPINGETYLKLTKETHSKSDSIEFFSEGKFTEGFEAIIKMMQKSDAPKWLTCLFSWIPRWMGNGIYRFIARHRLRSQTCLIKESFSGRLLK